MTVGGSINAVARGRKSGKLSSACTSALQAELPDAKDRAERLLTTLGALRR